VGFVLWCYTLMLPSLAKSGWLDADFLTQGLWWSWRGCRPEHLLGLQGLDSLTHSLFWSLLLNIGVYLTPVFVACTLWSGGQPGLAVCRRVRTYQHRQ
jgi:hypothetical protein